jgi:hypothetical protein
LCWEHHKGTNGVHGKNGKALDRTLKGIAETKWLVKNGKTKEDFIKDIIKLFIKERLK